METCEASTSEKRWSEDYDNIGEYFFESDHLAFKGNPDYHNLLKVMAILEAQRSQAIRDLDTLNQCHKEALSDPLTFVNRLQKKEPMNFPQPQRVAELPTINWNKYSLSDGNLPPMLKRKLPQESTIKESESDKVRGRVYDSSKPSTFNQLWSSSEQQKLEEFLVIYPPEEVESRRWQKISKALGTRTPAQVASRVQKYFIHLSKAGLAVPGRAPRRTTILQSGRGGAHRVTMLRMTSSFFKHHMPSVYMMDSENLDEVSCPASATNINAFTKTSNNEDEEKGEEEEEEEEENESLWEDPMYQELLFLQKLKQERAGTQPLAQHIGFKCDRCQCDPIVGVRWHCTDCQPESVDFCSDCVDCQEESGNHKSGHRLESVNQPIGVARPFLDGDYLHLMGSGQCANYLDSNYMPATTPNI